MSEVSEPMLLQEPISDGVSRTWQIYRTHFQGRTRFQDILIADTAHGRTLFCNNERQSSELSQLAYHEGQVMPALLSMPNLPQSALVIGSSEGVAVKILQEAGVSQITHVDIDEECMRACGEHLPYGYTEEEIKRYVSANDDSAIKIIIGDGKEYITNLLGKGKTYDLIVMDIPDEGPETEGLYNESFWADVKSLLSPDGAFITQAGNSCLWRCKTLKESYERMQKVFHHVTYFEVDEQDWVWLVGHAGKVELSTEQMQRKLSSSKYDPQYIDAVSLSRSVIAPKVMRMDY
ncbi:MULTISPECIES: spermidine synthase [Pseudomonas]|jgi:spermidine synthase|uniref:Polyamine aminopropyltransferase n=1 Tax=Pseudomonas fluorescens TaxID=294 RepID=A0A423N3I4_PSEFL|nr:MULTISPECIES: spermidine synthase [Pseudomonas]EJM01755.1 spermidine synthase [Pseudomonas sp. GM16]EJM42700.1 spermidine synthase [Pseudomonas sp. GM24]RON92630.1 spermidine synthase [Pseudomonas fluorescens]